MDKRDACNARRRIPKMSVDPRKQISHDNGPTIRVPRISEPETELPAVSATTNILERNPNVVAEHEGFACSEEFQERHTAAGRSHGL